MIKQKLAIALLTSVFVPGSAVWAADAPDSGACSQAIMILEQYIAQGCTDPALFELRRDLLKVLASQEDKESLPQ